MKALLVWHGRQYPPKHDLGLLAGRLPAGSTVGGLAIAGLTVYAVEQRYVAGASNPMALAERPTWDEADEAIETATAALAAQEDLAAAGWSETS